MPEFGFSGAGGSFGGGGASVGWGPPEDIKSAPSSVKDPQNANDVVGTKLGLGNVSFQKSVEQVMPKTGPTLFSDVKEITLDDSAYYANNQPMLSRILVDFAKPNVDVQDSVSSVKDAATSNAAAAAKTVLETGMNMAEDRPQRLISFDYNRTVDGIGQFSLTLFDSTWTEIEEKLVKNKGEFRLQYGYSEGTENTISPWYELKAFQYKVDFKMQGVILTITGLGTGWKMNVGQAYKGFEKKKISEIIKQMAKDSKLFTDYETWVEETQDVLTYDDMEAVGQIPKKFQITAQTPFQFVLNKLQPYARNKEGQGNYVFFFDNTPKGDTVLHFHTPYFLPKKKVSGTESMSTIKQAEQLAGIGSVPGFTMFKSPNSPVMNFTPDWRMSTIQLAGGGGSFNTIIDANTKQVIDIRADLGKNNNVIQATDNKPNILEEKPDNLLYINKDKPAFFINREQPRYTMELKAKTDADFSRRVMGAIRATLQIIGTPKFKVMDRIAVLVYIPSDESKISGIVESMINGEKVTQAVTKKNVHWISGYFRIIRIKDHISAGNFTTTFELVTDTRGQVADKPVNMEQK
jgi:hypothetical protein